MISRRRGYKFTKWTQLYNQAVVRFIYEVSGQSISKLYMWMGWGRAEGSKKMKKKKSCEEVTKGDYMDNKDIFYHTNRRNQH